MTIEVRQKYSYAADVKAAATTLKAQWKTEIAAALVMEKTFKRDDKHRLRLVIDHTPIDEVISGSLTCSIDMAARGWTAVVPFDETNKNRWNLFKPYRYINGHFPIAGVYLGGKLMCLGRCYEVHPFFNDSGQHLVLSGWSPVADALDSVALPPYEANKIKLEKWATTQLETFGLTVDWQASTDKPFKRVTIDKSEKVGEHLLGLARQRDVLMTSAANGNVVFHEVAAGNPVTSLDQGVPPFKEMDFGFDGRKRFGLYTVHSTSPKRRNYATAIDSNISIVRRTSVHADEADDADMKSAGIREASRALVDALTIPFPMPNWYRDSFLTNLWEQNTIVRIRSKSLFIPDGFDFLVRSVEYRYSETDTGCTVYFVPPQAYTGEQLSLWQS